MHSIPYYLKNITKRTWAILRLPIYKFRCNRINFTTEIGSYTHLRGNIIGKWCHIGPRGNINNAIIGNYTCIAPSCQIGGMEHPYWDLSISPLLSDKYVFGKTTTIGHDVWIAADCIIRQGVSIGNGAVIGAGSFVNKDIPPYSIAFGTPAKVIKYRFDDDIVKQLDDSHYWEYPPKKLKKGLTILLQQI